MRLTIQYALTDEVFPVEIDADGRLEDIKIMISIEKNLPVEDLVLMHNGKLLANDFASAAS